MSRARYYKPWSTYPLSKGSRYKPSYGVTVHHREHRDHKDDKEIELDLEE